MSVFGRMQGIRSADGTSKFPAKKPYVPIRFRLKKDETKQIVVLDENFTFGMREHSLQGLDGKWTTERCIAEWDACPLCQRANTNVYDILLLTCQDMTPWTNKDGVTVNYSKRELAVKKNDLPAFTALMNAKGSLRGIVLDMTRGNGEKESASGKPTFIDKLSEEDILAEFGHEARVSDKGTIIVAENDAAFPFNYEKYHTVPTRNELSRKYDIGPRPGSVEETIDQTEVVQLLELNEELPEVE